MLGNPLIKLLGSHPGVAERQTLHIVDTEGLKIDVLPSEGHSRAVIRAPWGPRDALLVLTDIERGVLQKCALALHICRTTLVVLLRKGEIERIEINEFEKGVTFGELLLLPSRRINPSLPDASEGGVLVSNADAPSTHEPQEGARSACWGDLTAVVARFEEK